MNQKVWVYSLMALSFLACSKSDSDVKKAEDEIQDLKKDQPKCDGVGVEHSGVYVMIGESGSGKCSEGESQTLEDNMVAFDCTQKDAAMTCDVTTDSTKKITGCVNKDGSFHLSDSNDLFGIGYSVGATSEETLTKIDVAMNGEEGTGTLQYASVASRGKEKRGCNASWELTIEKFNPEDYKNEK